MAHLKKIKIKKLFVEKTKIKKKRGREWLKKNYRLQLDSQQQIYTSQGSYLQLNKVD